jgi:exodeoxyribonuclease VII small subunit
MEKKISFEESIIKLEESVKRLESGNMSLDDALAEFEMAVGLVKTCNEKLEAAERKVKILVEGADGIITDKPFEGEADEA